MIEVKVEMEILDVKDIADRKVPFVLSKTLTELAQEANKEVKKHANSAYMIRRPWMMKGFRVQGARSKFLRAMIYHRDSYMHKHERGGYIRAQEGKHNVIPYHRGQKVGRASAELQKPDTFIRGRSVIRRKKRSRKYELLFTLSESAKYASTLKMEEIAREVVKRKADEVIDKHWLLHMVE